ncbi:sensor domain-containing phosphodiesterase [Sporosarcina sp. FSL K6-1508]|uniref:sensor domain-containing phosphodiesterase n=1 Tax=Sporosarcina sp. FSL K6-1508 TaxID=2921553 RepID=UPI0030F67711
MERSIEMSIESANSVLEELHEQQQLLFSQAKQLKLTSDSIKPILEETCNRILEVMQCNRVSIWLFNEDRTSLTAQMICDHQTSNQASGDVLLQTDVPSYFEAIQRERTLAVEDVMANQATRDFEKAYFKEQIPISSILDASILLSRGIGGVLCCETEKKRSWTTFDKVVIASLADMLAFLFDRLYRLEVEEHVHKLAFTDTLTGLDNQHSFTEKATQQLQSLTGKERGIFIYMVLDQFTEVQGALGYDGGEQVLKKTAERLQFLFPEPALTGRIGFDHFIIFYPYTGNRATREMNLDFVAQVLREPMDIGGQEVYMTFSYGVSYFPDHVSNVKEGLQAAQMALGMGRNKSPRKARGVYKTGMRKSMKETMLSEMNLRKGLDFNEFRLFYQPQVNCNSGEVIGFEALIRWQHPERGLIFPGDFIELAESTGLITPIGEWVIKEAFNQLAIWKEQGQGHFTVSINLSPRHFLHPKLPACLMRYADETGVDPQKLILEITENVALEDHVAVKKRIHKLSDCGFAISIDDFGTGYSAFIYLQHFPIQEIKIDRQFISTLDEDPKSTAIIQTIISLAQSLGLRTIAEGVETEEQWNSLRAMGCDDIQGFYFSKPLPIEEINRLMALFIGEEKLYLPVK